MSEAKATSKIDFSLPHSVEVLGGAQDEVGCQANHGRPRQEADQKNHIYAVGNSSASNSERHHSSAHAK